MQDATIIYKTIVAALLRVVLRKITTIDGVEHLPTNGGYILAANHVDWLDGFYLAAALAKTRQRPIHFLTKTNNYWWTTVTIQIPPEQKGAIVNNAALRLREGKIIGNFPEGARNPLTQLLPGKTGTVRMAADAGVPVVPVGITCDYGRTMAQSVRWLLGRHHPITIRFGAPLTFSHVSDDTESKAQLEDDTKRLMAAIAPLCGKSIL